MGLFTKLGTFARTISKSWSTNLTSTRHIFQIIQGKKVFFEVSKQQNKLNEWLLEKYATLTEVSSVINKIADYYAAVIQEPYDQNGKYIEDERIQALLNQPNQEQDAAEYNKKLAIYHLLFGNAFENAYGYRSSLLSFELKLLPSQYVEIVTNEATDFRNLAIKEYKVRIPNKGVVDIPDIENVLHYRNTSPIYTKEAGDLYGQSRLLACQKNIDSIEAGYGAKCGLYKHGPRVIITGRAQGEFAAANVQSDETTKQLQERINNEYGMQDNQYSVMITDIPLEVKPVSMNMGELQVNQNNIADFQAICRAFDIDSRVLSDTSSSTFSNVEMAMEAFLNVSFKAYDDRILTARSRFLSKLFKRPIVLKANYQNIPSIVEYENRNNDKLIDMTFAGLLTRNELFERINERLVNEPEFNEYFTFSNGQWIKVNGNNEINAGTGNNEGANSEDA